MTEEEEASGKTGAIQITLPGETQGQESLLKSLSQASLHRGQRCGHKLSVSGNPKHLSTTCIGTCELTTGVRKVWGLRWQQAAVRADP